MREACDGGERDRPPVVTRARIVGCKEEQPHNNSTMMSSCVPIRVQRDADDVSVLTAAIINWTVLHPHEHSHMPSLMTRVGLIEGAFAFAPLFPGPAVHVLIALFKLRFLVLSHLFRGFSIHPHTRASSLSIPMSLIASLVVLWKILSLQSAFLYCKIIERCWLSETNTCRECC